MFDRFLPQRIDNGYRGYRIALWLFGLVVALKLTQSVMAIIDGASIASSADGIPVGTYEPAAAQTVVALFALRSLWRLIFCLFCVLALVRYRSAIPLLFALLGLEYLGGELILRFLPIVRAGAPIGPMINQVAFAVTIVGLALSLWSRGKSAPVAVGR
jgi:hypothetical protein